MYIFVPLHACPLPLNLSSSSSIGWIGCNQNLGSCKEERTALEADPHPHHFTFNSSCLAIRCSYIFDVWIVFSKNYQSDSTLWGRYYAHHQEMLFFGLTTFYKTLRNCLFEVGATEWNYIWKSSFLRSPFYQYNLYKVYICTSPCVPIAAPSILLLFNRLNRLQPKFGFLQRRADGAGGWSTFYFPLILLGNRVFLHIWCLDCLFQK